MLYCKQLLFTFITKFSFSRMWLYVMQQRRITTENVPNPVVGRYFFSRDHIRLFAPIVIQQFKVITHVA